MWNQVNAATQSRLRILAKAAGRENASVHHLACGKRPLHRSHTARRAVLTPYRQPHELGTRHRAERKSQQNTLSRATSAAGSSASDLDPRSEPLRPKRSHPIKVATALARRHACRLRFWHYRRLEHFSRVLSRTEKQMPKLQRRALNSRPRSFFRVQQRVEMLCKCA